MTGERPGIKVPTAEEVAAWEAAGRPYGWEMPIGGALVGPEASADEGTKGFEATEAAKGSQRIVVRANFDCDNSLVMMRAEIVWCMHQEEVSMAEVSAGPDGSECDDEAGKGSPGGEVSKT